ETTPEADQNPPPPIESVTGTGGGPLGGAMGPMAGMLMMDPRVMVLRETLLGTVAGGITLAVGLAVVVFLAAVMPAVVAVPVAVASSTQGNGGFDPRTFLTLSPVLYGVLSLAFVPLIVLVGPAWDLVGFVFGSAFSSASPRASLISSVIAGIIPAMLCASVFTVATGAMLLALGMASSFGRNVPGDPNGVLYGALLGASALSLIVGVPLAIVGSLALRPITYVILRNVQNQYEAQAGVPMGM
ncbi:MAG: hypothetical protein AB2A00_43690, partial [Myxococcota bacterium]